MEIQFAFAFTAGLVSTINPCGFAMLPAYLAYFIGTDDHGSDTGTPRAVLRGLLVGATVSAGFLTVFGLAGVLLGAGIQAVRSVVPWLAMAVALGVIVLGVALTRGWEFTARLPKVGGPSAGRGLRNFYVFGLAYAVASLSCVLPIFLIVVTVSLSQAGFVAAATTSLVYALGMSLLLMGVTLAVALGKQSLLGWLRRTSQYVTRAAGVILVLAGIYIIFFWVSVLSSGGLTNSAIIQQFEQVQARLINAIGGSVATIGLALGASLALAVVYVWWTRTRRARARPSASSSTRD